MVDDAEDTNALLQLDLEQFRLETQFGGKMTEHIAMCVVRHAVAKGMDAFNPHWTIDTDELTSVRTQVIVMNTAVCFLVFETRCQTDVDGTLFDTAVKRSHDVTFLLVV